ncbi:unnamed protein product [Closterium sp. NIES-54]
MHHITCSMRNAPMPLASLTQSSVLKVKLAVAAVTGTRSYAPTAPSPRHASTAPAASDPATAATAASTSAETAASSAVPSKIGASRGPRQKSNPCRLPASWQKGIGERGLVVLV